MILNNNIVDKSWTLFLDRDGVINRKLENDYIKNWNEFEFLPGVLDALKHFSAIFGRIVVVTNQQGIGKGIYSHEDLNEIHSRMIDKISVSGGRIDKVYYCPDLHKDNSPNRKPNTGMAFQAKNDFPEIEYYKSIMVGDSLSDMEFGKQLNMKTFFISGKKQAEISNFHLIDYLISGLIEMDFIKQPII